MISKKKKIVKFLKCLLLYPDSAASMDFTAIKITQNAKNIFLPLFHSKR